MLQQATWKWLLLATLGTSSLNSKSLVSDHWEACEIYSSSLLWTISSRLVHSYTVNRFKSDHLCFWTPPTFHKKSDPTNQRNYVSYNSLVILILFSQSESQGHYSAYLPSSLRKQDGVLQNHFVPLLLPQPRWLAGQHGTLEVLQVTVALALERHAPIY